MPDMLGKEEKPFELGEYFSGRIQGNIGLSSHDPGTGATSESFQFTIPEVTLYPLTGPWGRYFSSLTELSFSSEDFWEIENAYAKFNYGAPESYFHVRFGVFHPFEGYGASDRPVGLSRPFFQVRPANQNQSTFFTPWGFDMMGLEGGYLRKGFSATVTVFNGNFVHLEDDGFKGFPAQGGELNKVAGSPSFNRKDIQVFLNQLIGENAGASLYYYHGWLDLPIDPTMPEDPSNLWRDSFDRFAVYGYTQPLPHLGFQAGLQFGIDHFRDPADGSTSGTFTSAGTFGELLFPATIHSMGALRYDYFDPSIDAGSNRAQGITAAFNYFFLTGLQFIAEYKLVDVEHGGAPDSQDHSFNLRLILTI